MSRFGTCYLVKWGYSPSDQVAGGRCRVSRITESLNAAGNWIRTAVLPTCNLSQFNGVISYSWLDDEAGRVVNWADTSYLTYHVALT